ncbi:MAG: DNA polymerase III subunit chi [Alphaproteobacteria bacterium]|nr:DNA polymerase III subunit chi [Alphaproteobacteria bacterium]
MPTDIRFYHLTDTPLERALPQLLEKAYGGKFRTLVKTADAESAKAMDSLLWAYDEASFLPHGLASDKNAAEHPILITSTHENTHGATLLAVTDGSLTPSPESFQRVLDIFHEDDRDAARERWKTYKDAGHALQYWQQTDTGWTQKA